MNRAGFRPHLAIFLVAALATRAFGSAPPPRDPLADSLAQFAAARNESLPALAIDLTGAAVVAPLVQGPEAKAVQMLVEDFESRTLLRPDRLTNLPAPGRPAVVVGTFSEVRVLLGPLAATLPWHETEAKAEGYQIITRPANAGSAPLVVVAGHDARGVLFGIGHLLRKLSLGPARAGLREPLDVVTSPRYALRGHQLGYRPKVNSYSGWDLPKWERYLRDLVIFGCNTIELLPPRTDDLADSPHFPRPQLAMMAAMSRLADDYGLDVWIWYPAMDKDYGKPETVAFAVAEWAQVFQTLPRIDAVLVPGGDPGHTPPRLMFPLLEKQTASLQRFHPRATMWMSPQGFDGDDLEYFFNYLRDQRPAWLKGVVFAPWIHMEIDEFRQRVPANYPIRLYPDITHTKECQFPVADWDAAFALTQGREPICPRPQAMAAIARRLEPSSIGVLTYSEGVNDDVNKAVWSAVSWNPDVAVDEVLRDYARYFVSERLADDFAAGLSGLENNWHGALAENAGVDATLEKFRDLERRATPADLHNWRFQSALYRAYFDASVRGRLRDETACEREALAVIGTAPALGATEAMRRATAVLEQPPADTAGANLRLRVFQLAEALFQSINYKTSVPLYHAVSVRRGATLDTLDYPLNNRVWLEAEFAKIAKLPDEAGRLAALDRIAHWTDAGPGGFYDDLGNPAAEPHLVPGIGVAQDPAFIRTPLNGFYPAEGKPLPLRVSWTDFIWGLNDLNITLRYTDLDPHAVYQVRVVYPPAFKSSAKIRLRANDSIEIHPYIARPATPTPVTFDIPPAATRDGKLDLTWNREPGFGGNGKGCEISEVWLLKKAVAPDRP